ncbi:hypothetical protein HOG17_03700 [Candidatus Peregrinibacteria bacterium]|jgi:hypothetical protein|nr:hypothetical protein [Candidatus Peregrinibacteria bacterium]MBT4148308.1 hypothetical protein [Candidatus Peregrinibacteria bacterium]MBT4366411.1 hypothetical protein [Candidatus Peregrinibacteria bacterium]MBT4455939.1 hypothetical protein [Candidatus Peregrinibacteria bacterium]
MDKASFQEFLGLRPVEKNTMRTTMFKNLAKDLTAEERVALEKDLLVVLEMQGNPGHEEYTGGPRDRLIKMCERQGLQFDKLLLSLDLCRTEGGMISQLSLNISPIREEITRVFAHPSVDQ